MKLKFLAALGIAATLYSCDDTPTGIGDFVANADEITAVAETYNVTTRTNLLDSIYSRTSSAYLGKYTDPEFGEYSAEFITQINCVEGQRFPDTFQGIEETTLELYYYNYYGDSLATLRVQVDTLNTAINDNGKDKQLYYTSFNPEDFYNKNAAPLAVKDYAAYNVATADSTKSAEDPYSITMSLGKDFCDYLTRKYEENDHKNFDDAHAFINNVLKGFYIHTTHGEGSVLYLSDIWLRMKVKYLTKGNVSGKVDSLVYMYVPFAASKEVFMSTRMQNSEKLKEFVKEDAPYTYLKTPAGLCTEVTLPLRTMYDELSKDTLNSITLSLTKMKSSNDGPFKMGVPSNLLLVRKSEMISFFENNKVADNITSFLASYDSSTNTYSFSKLNRLVSYIFSELRNEEKKDDDWDKILLIPVTTELDSEKNVVSISHDMEVNSARLVRGTEENPLNIKVIITKPTQMK